MSKRILIIDGHPDSRAEKGSLEQTLRPGFAFGESTHHGFPKKLLRGRSARIVVTMGMPAFFYRWWWKA